jgi:hypothetical protein
VLVSIRVYVCVCARAHASACVNGGDDRRVRAITNLHSKSLSSTPCVCVCVCVCVRVCVCVDLHARATRVLNHRAVTQPLPNYKDREKKQTNRDNIKTVSKETYYRVKRDLLQCQKIPTTVSKETYYRQIETTSRQKPSPPQQLLHPEP